MNFLQYLRGHPKDFEAWANITLDPSWTYEGVLPYYQAMEDFRGEFGSGNYLVLKTSVSRETLNHAHVIEDVHGHGGPLTVQPPPYTGMAEYFIKAGEEKGYQRKDLNGYFDEGKSV